MRKDLIAASGDTSWVTDEVIDGYTAAAAADLDGTLLAFLAMAEAREPERLARHLGEIRCPVRLVLGSAPHQGGVEKKDMQRLRERLPRFTVDTIPGAGQYLFEEQPESILAIIQQVTAAQPATLGSTQ
jgi:pimeloyl-ACP methyl ester carboxylesterase